MEGIRNENLPRYATGFAAIGISVYFLVEWRQDPAVVLSSLFLLLACCTDTLSSRIPNVLTFSLLAAGFGYNFMQTGGEGLLFAFYGMLVGLSLLILPFLAGGMGAGDVKALAALGAVLGPVQIFHVFIYTGLFGGLMAIFHYLLSQNLVRRISLWRAAFWNAAAFREPAALDALRKSEDLRFPYAAAIAFGFFGYLSWGALI